jgi:hypothetical protein
LKFAIVPQIYGGQVFYLCGMKDEITFVDLEIIDEVKNEITDLVSLERFASFHNSYAFNSKIVKNGLLFIGINPSNSKEDDTTVFDSKSIETYSLDQGRDIHKYFKKFVDISEHCKIPWTHIDLLFYKETNQKNGENLVGKTNGAAYIWEQLQLSHKLIQAAQPRCIIANNSFARTLMGFDKVEKNGVVENEWLGYDFVWDDNIGTYRFNGVPVFFSSMLTGSRALDRGSYARLKWHINKVCNVWT